jgi:hypothetical protein
MPAIPEPQPSFPTLGLDLGQAQDYSALCLLAPYALGQVPITD